MPLHSDRKQNLIQQYRQHDGDTGAQRERRVGRRNLPDSPPAPQRAKQRNDKPGRP